MFHKTVPQKKIIFEEDEIEGIKENAIEQEPTKQTNQSQIVQSNLVHNQTSREELEAFEAEMDNFGDQTMPQPFIQNNTLIEQQSDDISQRSSPLSLRHNDMISSPVQVKYAKGDNRDHMYKQDKK